MYFFSAVDCPLRTKPTRFADVLCEHATDHFLSSLTSIFFLEKNQEIHISISWWERIVELLKNEQNSIEQDLYWNTFCIVSMMVFF